MKTVGNEQIAYLITEHHTDTDETQTVGAFLGAETRGLATEFAQQRALAAAGKGFPHTQVWLQKWSAAADADPRTGLEFEDEWLIQGPDVIDAEVIRKALGS
jgi:hypothetical protein